MGANSSRNDASLLYDGDGKLIKSHCNVNFGNQGYPNGHRSTTSVFGAAYFWH